MPASEVHRVRCTEFPALSGKLYPSTVDEPTGKRTWRDGQFASVGQTIVGKFNPMVLSGNVRDRAVIADDGKAFFIEIDQKCKSLNYSLAVNHKDF